MSNFFLFKKNNIINLCLLFCISIFLPNQHLFIYIFCIYLSFKSLNHAMYAFIVSTFWLFLNPKLIGYYGSIDTLVRLTLNVICFIKITPYFFKGNKNFRFIFNNHNIFCFFLLLITLFNVNNEFKAISLLKLFSFYIGSSFILVFFANVKNIDLVRSLLGSIFFTTVVLSFFTILLPSYGYARNGYGFQGILNHPQMIGLFLIPFLIHSFEIILNSKKRFLLAFLASSALLFAFFSKARTPFASLFLVIIITSIICLFNKSAKKDFLKLFSKSIYATPLLLFIIFLSFETLSSFGSNFISKQNTGGTMEEIFFNREEYGFLNLLPVLSKILTWV